MQNPDFARGVHYMECGEAWGWTAVDAGVDFVGAREVANLWKSGIGAFNVARVWLRHAYVDGIVQGAPLAIVEAGMMGELNGRGLGYSTTVGLLSAAAAYVPGASTAKSIAQAVHTCSVP